ncbi:hypothetical protein KBT16_16405 [Nostoc sp. CCCryo 231-06]|nr:hypothetical protein [Nostoc sp. CCCryo 231-06]
MNINVLHLEVRNVGCNWGLEISLGESWGISTGILACMGSGIYELGRRDGESSD